MHSSIKHQVNKAYKRNNSHEINNIIQHCKSQRRNTRYCVQLCKPRIYIVCTSTLDNSGILCLFHPTRSKSHLRNSICNIIVARLSFNPGHQILQ